MRSTRDSSDFRFEIMADTLGQSVAVMNAPEVKKINESAGKVDKSSEKANIHNLANYTWSVALVKPNNLNLF